MTVSDRIKGLFSSPKQEPEEAQKEASVFKDYDIRGDYPREIDEEFARSLARAFVHIRKSKTVAVGYDSRLSSPSLAFAFAKECMTRGVTVVELGLSTTPFCAWVARIKKHDTVMVTASHNPPSMNGFKLFSGTDGSAISSKMGLKEIKSACEGEHQLSIPNPSAEVGKLVRKENYKEDYKKALLLAAFGTHKKNYPARNIKLAIDFSSGTASLFLNDILYKLGVTFETLHEKPDGTFPGHGPNPLQSGAGDAISQLLHKGRFTFGALFDADGDRVVFYDESGKQINASHVAALFGKSMLANIPSWKNVVLTTTIGRAALKAIEEVSGKVYIVPVGRTNVQPAMKKHRAVFGAETSGHYFFKDFDYWDSGIVALLKILSIISQENVRISELIKPLNTTVIFPEVSLPYEQGTEGAVIRSLRRHFGGSTETLDGLTVSFRSWWFNIRLSNTEQVWRLTMEGEDEDQLGRRQKEIESIVRNVKELTG